MIETPCWVQGAATEEDLKRIHVWSEMVEMQLDAAGDDTKTAMAFGEHMAALCLGFRRQRVA